MPELLPDYYLFAFVPQLLAGIALGWIPATRQSFVNFLGGDGKKESMVGGLFVTFVIACFLLRQVDKMINPEALELSQFLAIAALHTVLTFTLLRYIFIEKSSEAAGGVK